MINAPLRLQSPLAPKRRLLRIIFALLSAWAFLPAVVGQRVIVINTSPSVAPGFYVRSAREPAIGQIVDFRIPTLARSYVESRTGHADDDWYILKPIAAGPGDRVNTTGSSLVINGHVLAPDAAGA